MLEMADWWDMDTLSVVIHYSASGLSRFGVLCRFQMTIWGCSDFHRVKSVNLWEIRYSMVLGHHISILLILWKAKLRPFLDRFWCLPTIHGQKHAKPVSFPWVFLFKLTTRKRTWGHVGPPADSHLATLSSECQRWAFRALLSCSFIPDPNENGSFIDDFPSYKPPYIVDFPWLHQITRWYPNMAGWKIPIKNGAF